MKSRPFLASSLLISGTLHWIALSSLPEAQAKSVPARAPMHLVSLPPAPEPTPLSKPEPEVPPARPEVPKNEPPQPAVEPLPDEVQEPASPPDSEPPASDEAAETELTGTTLTADVGEGFSAPIGSGRARRGAFRAGVSRPIVSNARRSSGPAEKAPKPSKPQPPTLPLSALSRPPVPPDLTGRLAKNYPPAARKQGRSGEAKVRARVEASGRIGQAKVLSESTAGFGEACRRTLLESRWRAPLDQKKRPAATWISYRCQFRVSD